jgi:hypothetical protein
MDAAALRFRLAPALRGAAAGGAGLALAAAFGFAVAAPGSGDCVARSGATAPRVIELYTSEGCDSCPPADRWLSSVAAQPEVVALGFHVDYWDRLGWKDRFGSPAHTERQRQLQSTSGVPFSYTPQVIVDGRDWRGWPGLPRRAQPSAAAAPLQLRLDGSIATVERLGDASAGAPSTAATNRQGGHAAAAGWSAYWAVTEDGHQSQVRAGENRGATLRHDRVVVLYRPVGDVPAGGSGRWTLDLGSGAAAPSRRIAFVVVDSSQRPVQAVVLQPASCGR